MELKPKLENPDKIISKVAATMIVSKSKGRVFTITFRKRDGTLRVMNCRMGVKKGLTGTGMAYNPAELGIVPVFDMQANDYRMVNMATVIRLKINKKLYAVM